MYRLFVIARHTFVEAVVQPIFWLSIVVGAAILGIFAALPFFTLGEDTRMYKSVALDVILLLVLLVTLLATSRSIYEEIEDRTMLTLMSKPVSRLQVLAGKFAGLSASALLAVLAMGVVLVVAVHQRIPTDYLMRTQSIFEHEIRQLAEHRQMHIAGIFPGLLLTWLQVSVLAAISVAISTRFSFIVNLPAVLLIYLAGNLARFLDTALEGGSFAARAIGAIATTVLPYLAAFDQRDMNVYSTVRIPGTAFAEVPGVTVGQLWQGTAAAGLYAGLYVVAALGVGLILFRNRELGGAEG
jgi:ABC-type transport system involved in multi-copper enzyme maturation permease subunit